MMSVRLPESFWVCSAVRYVGLVVWIAYETFTAGQYFRKPASAPLNGISEKLKTVTVKLAGVAPRLGIRGSVCGGSDRHAPGQRRGDPDRPGDRHKLATEPGSAPSRPEMRLQELSLGPPSQQL